MHQGLDISDMWQGQNTTAINLLIMRHVPRNNRQAHIDTPQKGLNLDHLGHLTRLCQKHIKGVALCLVQCHPQRHLYRIAKRAPVHDTGQTLNDALLLHPGNAPRRLARCHRTALRQFSR